MNFNLQADHSLRETGKKELRKLLLEKSFLERWETVAEELRWAVAGRPLASEHQKLLPGYCYSILDLYKRTLLKAFAPISEVVIIKDPARAADCNTIEEAKGALTIDWQKLGAVLSIGERGIMFFENEAEHKLEEAGLLDMTPQQFEEIFEMVVGKRWLKKKLAEFDSQKLGVPVEEILEKQAVGLEEKIKNAVSVWHQKAREWGPKAVTEFHAGVAEGSDGFLNQHGELAGESKIRLINTYVFLLTLWPEIEEMLRANPPKTRNHLWERLRPFSYAGWIEIQDLEQLNRLCATIGLRLKKPGAPRKR